jgi:zinc resistance-associated protein
MWGYGHHRDYGAGAGWSEEGSGNLTDEQRGQLGQLNRRFYDETKDLRNEIWTKSDELNSVLNAPNPDTGKAKGLQKEIMELRNRMAEKRLDYDLEARKIAPDARAGRGYGRGFGKGHGRGYGRHMWGGGPGGSCWN